MVSPHSGIWLDAIGYLAGFLLVLTFFMRRMVPLRIVAICSSVAWLVYGALGGLYPIIILHIVLLPLNIYRLWQALREGQSETAPHGPS
jgi:CRP/FNR family transcriptional regulator, cyclic AMP receptor protein